MAIWLQENATDCLYLVICVSDCVSTHTHTHIHTHLNDFLDSWSWRPPLVQYSGYNRALLAYGGTCVLGGMSLNRLVLSSSELL